MSNYRNKALFSCTVTEKSFESVQRSAASRQLRLSPRSRRYAQQRGAGFLPPQCEARASAKNHGRYQPPEERPSTRLEDVLWRAPLSSSLGQDSPGSGMSASLMASGDGSGSGVIDGNGTMGGDESVDGSDGGGNSGGNGDGDGDGGRGGGSGSGSGVAQARPTTSTRASRPPPMVLDSSLPPRPHTTGAAAARPRPQHQPGSGPQRRALALTTRRPVTALALTTRRPVTALGRHWNPGQSHPSGRRVGTGQAALNPRAVSAASRMQQAPRQAERRLRAWQRAEHIALSRPIDRLSAPRRVRPVPANSRFKASPALFDLTTLRA